MAGPPPASGSESESDAGSGWRLAQSVRAANSRFVDETGASWYSESAAGEPCSGVEAEGTRVTEMVDSGSWSSYDGVSRRIWR